ncbi:hypothetical protein Sjap_018153 [Stephania japonica]|uniref:Pentatricopeptide repeat-containing protein n=1 Tax=Stephania japonica TaxID=461633 RepID=A0AAP0NK85_9MAGN
MWKEARGLLDEMGGHRISPSVVTFTILVDALCKDGKIKEAAQLFEEMRKRRVELNVSTYSSLINGLCNYGQWEDDDS